MHLVAELSKTTNAEYKPILSPKTTVQWWLDAWLTKSRKVDMSTRFITLE